MALKYRFNLKDIKLEDFKVYLLALFKAFIPKKKIKNIDELKEFIQKKSAWVSQVTLYGYLKTRMGTRYVLHFDNEVLLESINKAKWNIYSVALQDLTLNDFKVYLFALFKAFIPKKKINNLDELEEFIQTKSAWVTQVTLYGYLKTRMGTRYVLHFENDKFMGSVNLAKWNMYSVALQDLTFFTFSELKVNFNYQDMKNAEEVFFKILDDEITNKMPLDIIEEAKKNFKDRLNNINWDIYYSDLPFNPSALSLYKWAPIAEDLKSLDRKIVLNSVILKWDVVKKEFNERINF